MQENYFQKGLYICRKSMVVKIHLKTLGAIRNKKERVRYIQKGSKCFQLIDFSHSKSSEIAFSKLS